MHLALHRTNQSIILKTLFTFTTILFAQLFFAQHVFPEYNQTNLNQVDVDGTNIVVSGTCDQFWVSTDNGTTWDRSEKNIDHIIDIQIIDGTSKVLIGGQEGAGIYDFSNNSYENIYSDQRVNHVLYKNEKIYLVCNQLVLASDLDQINFEFVASVSDSDRYNALDHSDNYLFLGTNLGELYKVNISDYQYSVVHTFTNAIRNLSWVNDNMGYVKVSAESNFYLTKNGGSTMEIVNLTEAATPLAYDENTIISLNTNRIVVSTDGGVTSEYIDTDNSEEYSLATNGIFTEDGTLYLVGYAGMIVKTNDFGNTMTHLNSQKRISINAIATNDNGAIFTGSTNGNYRYTADNGITWIEGKIEENDIKSVQINDEGVFYIGTEFALFKYDNSAFTQVAEGDFSHIIFHTGHWYQFKNLGGGFVEIQRSEDAINWEEKYSGLGVLSDVKIGVNNKIYVGLTNGYIVGSADGENWEKKSVDLGNNISEINFATDTKGYAITNGKLHQTLDGENWEEIRSGYLTDNLTLIDEDQILYTTGSSQKTIIHESSDSGASFSIPAKYCDTAKSSFLDNDNNLWIGQRFGGLIRVMTNDPVSTQDALLDDSIILFPNPAIKGEVLSSATEWDQIIVLDLYGNIVTKKGQGNQFQLPDYLHTGIYVLKIQRKSNWLSQKIVVR